MQIYGTKESLNTALASAKKAALGGAALHEYEEIRVSKAYGSYANLVPVLIVFERAVDADPDILRLLVREFREMGADFRQV